MTQPQRSARLKRSRHTIVATLAATALLLTACSEAETSTAAESGNAAAAPAGSIRVVTPEEAKATIDTSPADLVVLDVRTQEEYDEGHLANAVLVDFYAADFADQLAALDPTVPYVLYCRSGNRSGQAREMMSDLGFVDVSDVDGGITSWTAAGLPTEK